MALTTQRAEDAVDRHERPGAVLFAADVCNLAVKEVFRPVVRSVLRQRDGEHEGVENAAVLGEERKFAHDCGNKPVKLLLIDHAKAGRAVHFALRHDAQKLLVFLVGVADQDFAAALEGKAKFLGQLSHHSVALDAQARLQRARIVGESAVAYACISGAGLEADVEILLQDGDVQLVARQLAGDGASDDAASDHDHVI